MVGIVVTIAYTNDTLDEHYAGRNKDEVHPHPRKARQMIAGLDTKVIVSAVLTARGVCSQILVTLTLPLKMSPPLLLGIPCM